MKSIVLSFAFLLALSFSALAQPKIEIIGGDTFDWGKVDGKNENLKCTFVIKNVGNQTLRINDVKPTCGCTNAPLTKNVLDPNDTAMVHVTLKIGTNAGKNTKSIIIKSNDASRPEIAYHLTYFLERPINIYPQSFIAFDQMQVGKSAEKKIFMKNNTSNDVIISSVEVSPETLKSNIKEGMLLKPGKEYEIIATTIPQTQGYYRGTIKLKTNSPEMPTIEIYCYGNVAASPIFNSK